MNPLTRKAVYDRDAWRCRRCGWPAANFDLEDRWPAALEIHHRLPRRMGGRKGAAAVAIDHPDNLVVLCRLCHSWVESHRTQAHEDGWLLHEGETRYDLVDANGLTFDVRDEYQTVQSRTHYYGPS